MITVGDNAYQNGTQSDWDNNVFTPEYRNQILRRTVFMPTLGNHDLNNVGAANWASSVEIKMHLLPRNAPAGQEERFFVGFERLRGAQGLDRRHAGEQRCAHHHGPAPQRRRGRLAGAVAAHARAGAMRS